MDAQNENVNVWDVCFSIKPSSCKNGSVSGNNIMCHVRCHQSITDFEEQLSRIQQTMTGQVMIFFLPKLWQTSGTRPIFCQENEDLILFGPVWPTGPPRIRTVLLANVYIVLFGNLYRIYAGVISLQRSTYAQQLSNLQEITIPPLIQTKEIQSIRFRKKILPWLFLNRTTRNNHVFFWISFGGTPEKACWLTSSPRVFQFPESK